MLQELRPELVQKLGPRLRAWLQTRKDEWAGADAWQKDKLDETTARISDEPSNALLRYTQGWLLVALNELPEAEQAFRKAVDLEPRYLDARYALARVLNDLGRYDEALEELDQLLELDRWYGDAYLEKAHALRKLGREPEAAAAQNEGMQRRQEAASWSKQAAQKLEWEPSRDDYATRGAAAPPSPELPPSLSVSVQFEEGPTVDSRASYVDRVEASKKIAHKTQDTFLRLLWELGIEQVESQWLMNLVSLTVTEAQLQKLLYTLNEQFDTYGPTIERIEKSRPLEALIQGAALSAAQIRALGDLSPVMVQAQPRSSPAVVGADRLWSRGLTGAGCKVAVIDTGICDEHRDLASKITFPPASQINLPYVYGEAIQGGNYVYEVHLPPDLQSVEIELVTGLEFNHVQLQAGMGAARLDLRIYAPDSNRPLAIPEQIPETDGAFSRRIFPFQPQPQGGRYRVHVRGADVDGGDTPWRGVLFKLSARDVSNYPGRVLPFVGPYDDHAHGTHVAGIVAGTGESSGGAYKGVAPGASVISAKVLSYEGTADDARLADAIQWAVAEGADVVNISFGTYDEFCNGDCLICQAADKAVQDHRIVVVAAAGNLGGEGPGHITCPGKAAQVITVGSCSVDGVVSDFSSRGPEDGTLAKPDLVAPGEGIISCLSNRHFVSVRTGEGVFSFEPLTPLVINSSYIGLSGTSMAAPHVAGAAALLLQADPTLTPERIKQILMDTATPLPGQPPRAQGRGMLNLEAALRAVPQVIVDTIRSTQDTYTAADAEITLEVTVRNNHSARSFQNLFVDLSLLDEQETAVYQTTVKDIDLDPAQVVTRQVVWSHPPALQPGPYHAMATVRERRVHFPAVPAGNVQVLRNLDHYFTGAIPVFGYA